MAAIVPIQSLAWKLLKSKKKKNGSTVAATAAWVQSLTQELPDTTDMTKKKKKKVVFVLAHSLR